MVALLRHGADCLLAILATAPASPGGAADGAGTTELLALQATARVAASLAEGNHCAGMELRPRIEAALRYLEGKDASGLEGDDAVARETATLLRGIAYDQKPCDTPCFPPAAEAGDAAAGAPPYGPEATAKHRAALDDVVTRWLSRAERDPPTLTIATSRHSYDPLPHYAPGQPVDYRVHVGAACHGALLTLDREFELPSSFDGAGSFTPARDGLWTIHLQRRDGLPLSPLIYLEAETGLPSYYREFWVSAEPVGLLGPGGVGPWHRRP